MSNQVTSKMGWLVACVMGVFLFASGFQDGASKFGVVDVNKVLRDSEKGKKLTEELQTQFNTRQGLLEFVAANPTISAEQASKLRELSVKLNTTAAEKTEIENIKKAVVADENKFASLGQKADLTEGERAELEDLGTRRRNAQGMLGRWQQEFTQELQTLELEKQADLVDKVKSIVQDAAKKGGYTMVFQTNVAIYGANDLTDEATKALNAAP